MKVNNKESGRSMIEMLEKVKQPLNAVLRRQAQVFRCCQSAFAPRSNTENQVTEAPLGARQRPCALAQSGRSMIEMLGVLAIIGVLSVGGIAGYSKAMSRYQTNKTLSQITQIVGNIHTFFAPQKSYDGVGDVDVQKKAKLVPDEMWVEGLGRPQNVFGGSVAIGETRYDVRKANKSAFLIGFQDISYDACLELATHNWKELNAYMCTIGEFYFDELLAVMDDVIKQGKDGNDDNISLCKGAQMDVRSEGWYWQCFGDGDAPLGIDDAVAACNNVVNPAGTYHMVCTFF